MISELITHLTNNCPDLAQVIRADATATTWVDASAVVFSTLQAEVSGRLSPIMIPADTVYPAACFQLVSSKRIGSDGNEFFQEDRFIVQVYAMTYAEIVSIVDAMRGELLSYTVDGSAGSIEVSDIMFDFDSEKNAYWVALELTAYHLSNSLQTLPAAILNNVRSAAIGSQYDNTVVQPVTEYIDVILVSKSSELETHRESLMDCLLGFQIDTQSEQIEYSDGIAMAVFGETTLWRETFLYTRFIRE